MSVIESVIEGLLAFNACLATAWGLICLLKSTKSTDAANFDAVQAAAFFATSVLFGLLLLFLRKRAL